MKREKELFEELRQIREILDCRDRQPLTFEEATSYLRVSRSYLYKLTSAGSIPHYKPEGKIIYFEKSELDDWIFRNRIPSKEAPTNIKSTHRLRSSAR